MENAAVAEGLRQLRLSLEPPPTRAADAVITSGSTGMRNDINDLEANMRTLMDHNDDMVDHLHRQISCYRESIDALRNRCDVLVAQNAALHAELEQHIQLDIQDLESGAVAPGKGAGMLDNAGQNHANMVDELLQLRVVYEQQVGVLERQVKFQQLELETANAEVDRLRNNSDRCRACNRSLSDEVSPDVNTTKVERLEREKEELDTALANLQSIVTVMKGREEEAMAKVKRSMEAVEKIKADQEALEIKLKKSHDELNRTRERHSLQVAHARAELQQDHEEVLAQMRDEIRALESDLKDSNKENAMLQTQLDSIKVEKADLVGTVERYRHQGLSSLEVVDKTSQELRNQLRKALDERDEAISSMALHKNSVQLELHDRTYEVKQLQNELAHAKERLSSSEDSCRSATLESSRLQDQVASLKISLSKVQNEKLSLEKTTGLTIDHLKMVSEQSERQSRMELEEINSRHKDTVSQLHSLLQKQQSLANKWRKAHVQTSEEFSKNSSELASSMAQIKKENTSLKTKNTDLTQRNHVLSTKNKQLKATEKKMNKSLKLAESHIIKTAEELYNTVQKRNELLKERNVMCKEITLLQAQLCDTPHVIGPPHDVPEKDT